MTRRRRATLQILLLRLDLEELSARDLDLKEPATIALIAFDSVYIWAARSVISG